MGAEKDLLTTFSIVLSRPRCPPRANHPGIRERAERPSYHRSRKRPEGLVWLPHGL